MMARVRGVILLSTWAGSRLYVSGSMSTKTGFAPSAADAAGRGEEGEGRQDDLVAGADLQAGRASERASVPEPQPTPWLAPQ